MLLENYHKSVMGGGRGSREFQNCQQMNLKNLKLILCPFVGYFGINYLPLTDLGYFSIIYKFSEYFGTKNIKIYQKIRSQ